MLANVNMSGSANQSNTYTLEMDVAVANQLDWSVNGGATQTMALSPTFGNNQVVINGAGTSNFVVITEQNGTVNGLIPATITILNSGGNPNTLVLNQTGSVVSTSDSYTVGPAVGQGQDVIVGNTTQTVNFTGLSPVLDTVLATTQAVNATPGNNAINYTVGPNSGTIATGGAASGQITIDNQESYEFANKTNLVINSFAGSDQINLNNQSATKPAGLTSITVNGNDPTGPLTDVLTINGLSGSVDHLTDAPTGTGAGGVTDPGSIVFVPVTYTGIEGLNIVGQTADADGLFINNTTGTDTLEYAPGPTPDAGTLTGTSTLGGGFAYVPITFTGITAEVSLFAPVGSGNATLLVDGTANDDTFAATDNSNVVSITENTQSAPIFVQPNATATYAIRIRGQGGNDALSYTAVTGASASVYAIPISFQGGDSASPFGDSVTYTAASGTTATIGLAVSPAVQTITPSASGNVLSFSSAQLATVNTSGVGAIVITGAAGDDSLSYTDVSASTAIFQDTIDGQLDSTSYTVNDPSGLLTFNGGTGSNGIVFNANKTPDAIGLGIVAAGPAISDNGNLGLVLGTNVQNLSVLGGAGNDTMTVSFATANPIPTGGLNFNGGGGFNALVLTGGSESAETYLPGPINGSGTFTISSATSSTITFQNLSPVFDNVPGPLIVTATNSSNAINYKEGFSTLANYMSGTPSTTWGEVSIDGQEPEEFTNKTTLTINGLAGSDAINLDNQFKPTSLTAITVNGNDPTGTLSDVLTVNGIAGVSDNGLVDTPTGTGAGSIADPAAAFVPITYTGIEGLTFVGQTGDADSVGIVNTTGTDTIEYAPGATPDAGTLSGFSSLGFNYVPLTFTGFSASVIPIISGPATAIDTLLIDGTANDDAFTFNATGGGSFMAGSSSIVVNGHTPIYFNPAATTQVVFRGQGGNDTFNYVAGASESAAAQAVSVLFQGGDSSPDPDVVNYTPLTGAAITVGLAASGNAQTIAAVGSNTLSFTGAEVANILAPLNSTSTLTVNGTGNDDTLNYTPSDPTSGTFQLAGGATQFNFTNIGGTFTFAEPGGLSNTLVINGTSGRDTFDLDAFGRTASVAPAAGISWKAVVLGAEVQVLTAVGYSGEDTFQVTPAVGTEFAVDGDLDNLLINVDGGGGGTVPANNALVVWSEGSTLPATDFVVVDKITATSGIVRTYGSELQWPDINYSNITTVSPQVVTSLSAGGATVNTNLLWLGPDSTEGNDSLQNATYLGSAATIQVPNGVIFPNSNEFPGVPNDTDYYRVVAQNTGTLDFQVYFNLYNGLLPGSGNLDVQVYDSVGDLIADASSGATDFGADGAAGNARVRIPAVAGQTYYVEIFGSEQGSFFEDGEVVNGYSMTVINTAPPVPYDGELSRSVSAPDAGPPDTGDLPTGAAADDSGRSQFDNVTNINTPTVYFRLTDAILLQDLQGNDGTTFTNNPPVGQIPIPFVNYTGFSVASLSPGYRVAIFDGNNTQTPVGFASQVPGSPGLYAYTFTSPLADGVHHLVAAVQIIDPTGTNLDLNQGGEGPDPVLQTGFGSDSTSLDITIDTVAPPVFFGNSSTGTIDGLTPASDSGVTGQLLTFNDRVTNVTQPTFFGSAEANAIIDVYALESSSVQAGATPATQILTINATAGTFTLSYQGGAQTTPLAFNATAAQVQAAINTIFNFNTASTNVSVSKSGNQYTVTFQTAPASLLAIGGNPFSGGTTTLLEPEILLGETTAVPVDGTNAFPGGSWTLTSNINLNDPRYFAHDGSRQLWVTATDLAGNVSSTSPANAGPGQTFLMDIDTQGPTVGGFQNGTLLPSIQILGSPTYNVFLEKTDGVPTPTPNVNQLVINVFDPSPHDTADFPIPASGWALIDAIAQTPGAITVTGAANGIMPIQSVVVTNQTVNADGQIEATLVITFQPLNSQPLPGGLPRQAEFGLPDDRYTITINDSLVDIAGNALDGETNGTQPVANPKDPSGNGVPGGAFVASFTVDSHPEIATYSDGTVNMDLNGNGTFDPTNTDFTNRDASVAFGYGTDTLFAGDLYPAGAPPVNSFDKLGAYGLQNGTFRWLINFAGNGSMDPSSTGTYVESAPYEINGTPFVINYNGRPMIGLFDGNGNWYLDYNGNDTIGPGDKIITGDMKGQPVIGDFNGDGFDDLATYYQGSFYIDLAGPGGVLTGNWNTVIAVNNTALISGAAAKPVAADINGDGVTDLGLYLPGRTTQPNGTESEWYFLISDGVGNGIAGLNHSFEQYPLGTDVFYTFGSNFALPLVGNFDPPTTSGGTSNTTPSMQNVQAGGTLTLSSANKNALSVTDLGGGGQETVSLSVNSGLLSLSKLTGLSFTSGTGKNNSSMTFSGSTASVNAALDGLTFAAPNKAGPAVLTFTSGETGSGATEASTLTINANSLAQQQGSTLTINGSGGSDTVSVTFQDPTHFTVVINGQSSSYTTASVNKVVFAGAGGHESVTFTDAVAADMDLVTLQMGTARVARLGFEFDVSAAQSINVYGNARSVATLLDAAGGRFVATVAASYLTGNGMLAEAYGFGAVNAQSAAPAADTATFYAGNGSSIIATPTWTQMKGTGYQISAYGFPATYSYSDAAGTSVASLTANPNSTFIGMPTYATMRGAGYFNEVFNFKTVNAFGNATSAAFLYDTAGNDLFTGSGNTATMHTSTGVATSAFSFGTVNIYSSKGTDTAQVAATDYAFKKYGTWH